MESLLLCSGVRDRIEGAGLQAMGDILLFLIGVEVSRKCLGADCSDLGCCDLWLGNEVEALVGVLVSCLRLEFGW